MGTVLSFATGEFRHPERSRIIVCGSNDAEVKSLFERMRQFEMIQNELGEFCYKNICLSLWLDDIEALSKRSRIDPDFCSGFLFYLDATNRASKEEAKEILAKIKQNFDVTTKPLLVLVNNVEIKGKDAITGIMFSLDIHSLPGKVQLKTITAHSDDGFWDGLDWLSVMIAYFSGQKFKGVQKRINPFEIDRN
eukprot:TRINITY_DN13559_c0_g1_i2.p1 TRINITY_DN13559_c0_g1~~TRINITY_DN13559_c0_g1_i2.p1  ORF type:complete len:193 (+),score=18.50 TRINITY_DN13559_c0_g1_i2:135-713(+)